MAVWHRSLHSLNSSCYRRSSKGAYSKKQSSPGAATNSCPPQQDELYTFLYQWYEKLHAYNGSEPLSSFLNFYTINWNSESRYHLKRVKELSARQRKSLHPQAERSELTGLFGACRTSRTVVLEEWRRMVVQRDEETKVNGRHEK